MERKPTERTPLLRARVCVTYALAPHRAESIFQRKCDPRGTHLLCTLEKLESLGEHAHTQTHTRIIDFHFYFYGGTFPWRADPWRFC